MANPTDPLQIIRDMAKVGAANDPTAFRRMVLDDFIAALNAQFPDELRIYRKNIPQNDPGFPFADVVIHAKHTSDKNSLMVDLGTWRAMSEDIVDVFQQASHIGLLKITEKRVHPRTYFTEEHRAVSIRLDDCLTEIVYLSAMEQTP